MNYKMFERHPCPARNSHDEGVDGQWKRGAADVTRLMGAARFILSRAFVAYALKSFRTIMGDTAVVIQFDAKHRSLGAGEVEL